MLIPRGAWAGFIQTTPDVVPVIEETDEIPGFHIATGFCGHGFGISPGAGKAIARMLSGTDSVIGLSGFRLSRFFDESRLQFQQAI